MAQVAYLLLLGDNTKQLNLEAVNAERLWQSTKENAKSSRFGISLLPKNSRKSAATLHSKIHLKTK
jgi:hypothetical protein